MATPLSTLVRQYLMGRTDGLPAPQLAAFISGWCSALELLRHLNAESSAWGDVATGGESKAPGAVEATITALLDAIETAQREVLEEDSEDGSG